MSETSMSTRGRRIAAAVAMLPFAVIVAMGGYSLANGSDADDEAASAQPWTPPAHPPVDVPEGRDEAAVLAALRQLDACALIEPAAAKVPPFSSRRLVEPNPHQCEILQGWRHDVRATVGMALDRAERFAMRPEIIAGAKAYLRAFDGCEVNIPVSSTRAIQIAVRGFRDQNCRIAERFAATAIHGLQDVASVRANTQSTRWDACTVLRRVLGDDLGRRYLEPDPGDYEGLDHCGVTGPRVALAPPIDLSFSYGSNWESDRSHGDRYIDVDGRRALIYRGLCTLDWTQGPSGEAHWRDDSWNVALQAPTCDQATGLARSIMRILDGPPPPAAPLRPALTYRPAQSDVLATGACVDLSPTWTCAPYDHVSPPTGADQIARAAGLDPNVNCAIALDAVREHYGPTLTPVTTTGFRRMIAPEGFDVASACVFVEPTHTLQVWVTVREPGILPLAEEGLEETTIAGWPATMISTNLTLGDYAESAGFTVALGGDPYLAERFLDGWVTRYPPRGTVPDGIHRDLSPAQKLPDLLSDIIADRLE